MNKKSVMPLRKRAGATTITVTATTARRLPPALPASLDALYAFLRSNAYQLDDTDFLLRDPTTGQYFLQVDEERTPIVRASVLSGENRRGLQWLSHRITIVLEATVENGGTCQSVWTARRTLGGIWSSHGRQYTMTVPTPTGYHEMTGTRWAKRFGKPRAP